jgi:hypothetical protein
MSVIHTLGIIIRAGRGDSESVAKAKKILKNHAANIARILFALIRNKPRCISLAKKVLLRLPRLNQWLRNVLVATATKLPVFYVGTSELSPQAHLVYNDLKVAYKTHGDNKEG